MRYYSELTVYNRTTGRPPRSFGLNVEMQDHHDTTNLWDWIADSGSTCIRTFHPEVTLRGAPANPNRYASVNDYASFDHWRQAILADVDNTIPWADYRFQTAVPWLGEPDGLVSHYAKVGVEILYSLGYWPTLFPRPLVREIGAEAVPGDAGIDWGAAACAYEYYLAVIYRYASRHRGRVFMMINEPENRDGAWYLPDELANLSWTDTFWDDAKPGLAQRVLRLEAVQYAVLARIARMAINDVAEKLGRKDLVLTGPTTVAWPSFWAVAEPYLDCLDAHHYHPDAHTFADLWTSVSETAAASGKTTMLSEFNRHSGGIDFAEIPFATANALDTAKLLFQIMSLPGSEAHQPNYATLYLLGFPSTHRNYKHLVYGDMELVDWSGADTPLWDRGSEWYPSFEESQLRHPTPAYAVVRMLARHAAEPHTRVVAAGMHNPTTSGPADLHDHLQWLVTSSPEETLVSILNDSDRPAKFLTIDVSRVMVQATTAVVRITDRTHHDQPIACRPVRDGRCTVTIPAKALVQIVIHAVDTAKAQRVMLGEHTFTPGSIADGLQRFQTTLLTAVTTIGTITEDLTHWAIQWTSSHPHLIRIGSGGLVQRLRDSQQTVTLTASVMRPDNTRVSAQITIPGNLA